ncbi:MAG: DUF4142 domain-containing protein [Variovorax sp.]|nr:DUF4142 domain-containing protein [Variovorax sp.]
MTRQLKTLALALAGALAAGAALGATSLSRTDSDALQSMAQANMAEVEAGQMALKKAQDPKVKQFAQMMVDDHSAGLKDVQQVAQSKGVTLPTEPNKGQKSQADTLSKLEGASFDRQYMEKAGVSDHTKDHDELRTISKNAKDTDVKNLAAKMLPVVDRHLAEAKRMAGGK